MEGAVVGSLVENLISLLKREFSLIRGVQKDVTKLVRTLSTIQAVLEDAEEKQIKNKPIAHWLRHLKDATYDADDVLDAWVLEIQQRELEISSVGCTSIVSPSISSCFCFKRIIFYRKIAKQIKKILSTFDEIAAQKSQFHLNTGDMLQTESQFSKERETSSVINEPCIYGRDVSKKKIIDMLVYDFVNHENVSIFPIVGMGGLGKTTLAQSIYNDENVQKHFEVKIWVCVSHLFDLERVLKAIIESFYKKACDLVVLEVLNRMVEEILKGKRYFVVLDDVWTENQDQWDKLKSSMKGGAAGSSVLLTTRSSTVASITGTVLPYRLGALSDDDCFSLFKSRALGEEEEHPNLVTVGKEIAKKCRGVPLVAKSLGALLRFKTDEKQWELIRDCEIWTLTGENTILAALRLSYNHLSSCLKQCFAYCSIFPKDFTMEKRKLICLWMANGFIQSQGNMELEEVGNYIFSELLRLSFFQNAIKKEYLNIETCKMHDLMHDLACSVSRNECLIANAKHVPVTIRHLTVVYDSPESTIDPDHLCPSQSSLRTLRFLHATDFCRFQFSITLRVLDLCQMGIDILPPSVCDLIHLRYLDLSGNLLTSLPESLHKLRNLLMLDLSGNKEITSQPLAALCNLQELRHLDLSRCSKITSLPASIHELKNLRFFNLFSCAGITSLPENMRNMSSLRHLDVRMSDKFNRMPVGIGQLRGLETLTEFVVGKTSLDGDSRGGAAGISELHGLNQLKGSLNISGLENVTNQEDAKLADLSSKRYLTNLRLTWGSDDDSLQVNKSKEVLEGLLPLPPNLQKLFIKGYGQETCFPEGFLDLSALRSVVIHFCHNLRSLPRELENLKSLRSLTLRKCDELVSLPEGLLRNATSLEYLAIIECKSLKSLEIQGAVNLDTSSSCSHLQSSLQIVGIHDCPELVFSEVDFQHLNALCHLRLDSLPQLTALPQGMQHLPMLRNLNICLCSNLRMFPEWIKHLSTLQFLEVMGCHEELHKRCEKDKGQDWHLISHIPHLTIKQVAVASAESCTGE